MRFVNNIALCIQYAYKLVKNSIAKRYFSFLFKA